MVAKRHIHLKEIGNTVPPFAQGNFEKAVELIFNK